MKQTNVSVLPHESELKVDSSRVIEKEDLSAISMGIQENKEAENAFFAQRELELREIEAKLEKDIWTNQ